MDVDRAYLRNCLVCTAKAESAHFGIDTCRACAAFFRRTVTLKRTYLCRQSKDNCNVSKDVKFCRRCRYKKCLAVGMKPENVPIYPTIPMAEVDSESRRANTISESSDAHTSPTDLLELITEQFKLLEQIVKRSDEILMARAYGDHLQKRNDHFPATIGLVDQCMRAAHQPMIDFATNCFPELLDFDDGEKWLVLKNFMTSRFIFDGVYRPMKYFPGNSKIFMVTFLSYVDIDNLKHYISDLDAIYDKEHTVRIMRDLTSKCISVWLGPLLTKAKLDEVETMAIYGLLCWPPYLANASTKVMETSYKYHLRIFQELHHYYKRKGGREYSSRVSHISSILLCVQAAIQRLKEDFEIFRLLDVYSGNELVYRVVR